MKIYSIAILAVAITAAGCSAGDRMAEMSSQADTAAPAYSQMRAKGSAGPQAQEGVAIAKSASFVPGKPENTTSIIANRLVIRDATLSVRVDNVELAEKHIEGLIDKIGGYVESASSSDLASTSPQITLSARVPASQFDDTIDQAEALGTRLSKTISSQDVTEQVVDLDARNKTMQAEEELVRNLLRQSHQLDDMLTLQQRLSDIRANIESTTAQRQSLAKRASMSSITLTLQQGAVITTASKDPGWLTQTWGEASTTMGSAMRVAATLAIWAVTFCPFWIPALLVVRRYWPRQATA